MELLLEKAEVLWLAKPSKKQVVTPRAPQATQLTVLPPYAEKQDEGAPLPCNISISAEELTTKNKVSLLDQYVTFKLLEGEELVATHARKLRDCIPVLTEGSIHWTQPVLHKDVLWDVGIHVYVKTNRRPRALVSHALALKNGASSVARQLALHKNKAVIGLLPAVAGCVVGIIGTSPVWLPLTLLVGVMGFPVWIVVGVAMALVTLFSTISAVVTVKLARSERVKGACQHFLTSQQGQLLLFEGMPGEESLSTSALSARAKEFVLENPSRKLVASLAIDFLGNATFVVPGLGEMADVLWAPVSAKMVDTLYKESSPHAKYVAFLEELLPFTDIIPTATLAWMKENLSSGELDKLFALTKFHKQA
ncbi:hypothetical protein L915_15387 [Phytophthora nicotianae]|uniref:Uncharacterized protein n=4 Tax=Phytophthora nicotianae TaxID=4792 RepID=W2R2U7_PHYN3|nr:hypothetical protein PPTG_04848 [Phytophthora nicotianae INRA-310]ETK78634.1 hypothetical protein L915_15387 [Phytophthora nicotianae]ETO67205.1 hypothetical protein F444_15811 [Phytophthora nicotianae P1976]KUF77693.1 hypothetical protein AM587_10016730 [Phytophthora nicotianae]ETM38465.1 hypothetical protein L914_15240 [Phytophthora nicotianae]ETN19576.1 hypothetical protein PPTG_04848 [Phytophthora nicotianae INRA-310]